MMMTQNGATDGGRCRPFCGALLGCSLQNTLNGEDAVIYSLHCRCSGNQCSELLVLVSPSVDPTTEICNIFMT